MRCQRGRRVARIKDEFADLPRRVRLTVQYWGWRTVLVRVLTFPLRLTPLRKRLGVGRRYRTQTAAIKEWFRRNGKPVAVVIPAYGDPTVTIEAVESIKKTSP